MKKSKPTQFEIETVETVRKNYVVDAASEAEAREKFDRGDVEDELEIDTLDREIRAVRDCS